MKNEQKECGRSIGLASLCSIACAGFLVVGAVLASTATAVQTEPATLSYQGTLTDNNKNPLPDGSVALRICLYQTENALAGLPTDSPVGEAFWCDSYTVTLRNGQFSVVLGRSTKDPNSYGGYPPKDKFVGSDVYLGMKLGASDPEMTQRQKITSVAFSLNADNGVPPGTVVAFAGAQLPSGWLWCDGSAVSRITYKNLYNAVLTTWGAGNGVTTFNVPALQNRFLRGAGAATDGNGGTSVALGAFQVQSTAKNGLWNSASSVTGSVGGADGAHSHTYSAALNMYPPYDFDDGGSGWMMVRPIQSTLGGGEHGHGFSLTAQGQAITGDPETRPGSYGVNYIIKY